MTTSEDISASAPPVAEPASCAALRLARLFPRLVRRRRRGYRVLDRLLRTLFGRGLSGRRLVRHGDVTIEYDLSDYIERLMAYELHGEESFGILPFLLRPGDTFVDAGAYVGYFSAAAADRVGPSGCVHSIEANPETAKHLRANAARNSGRCHWTVHETALSDQPDQTVVFHVSPIASWSSLGEPGPGQPTTRRVEVRTDTFDRLSSQWKAARLLKIDIEGAETLAFQGAARWMRSEFAPSFVICEFNDPPLRQLGGSAARLLDAIRDFGYSAWEMRWKGARRIRVRRVERTPDFSSHLDLLFCRPKDEADLGPLIE